MFHLRVRLVLFRLSSRIDIARVWTQALTIVSPALYHWDFRCSVTFYEYFHSVLFYHVTRNDKILNRLYNTLDAQAALSCQDLSIASGSPSAGGVFSWYFQFCRWLQITVIIPYLEGDNSKEHFIPPPPLVKYVLALGKFNLRYIFRMLSIASAGLLEHPGFGRVLLVKKGAVKCLVSSG